ncbi:FAD/NAD(P)-binding protein [Alteribacter aurantiacus]|uniref:FAD/NAD(P)-binding protein n=1 Tax=Alteribacter aurantiacus TaxID=254410 RepID=UPI00040F1035|nr:FAD/NAD(P)-binding protein [Alteribacter aurantiacus]
MFEWTIIGGGIQGATVASFLSERGVKPAHIAVVDPHNEPLENWKHCTGKIEMEYLRSPFVHHLEESPFSLDSYAKKEDYVKPFLGRRKRPKLQMFNDHSTLTLESRGLHESWVKGRVTRIKKGRQYWTVTLSDGQIIESKYIVVAIGLGEQPYWPDWATDLNESSSRVSHVFDRSLNTDFVKGPVTIIGGGITAAHLAVKLSRKIPGQVTLVKRHPFRIHEFDSDSGWMGPKNMAGFLKQKDPAKRRQIIRHARHRGSITQELQMTLLHLERSGSLSIKEREITHGTASPHGMITLYDHDTVINETASVILCTGFKQEAPGMTFLNSLIKDHNLLCAACGYPLVPDSLEWCDHLYLTGGLAELELGPTARNISGARRGASRIVQQAL